MSRIHSMIIITTRILLHTTNVYIHIIVTQHHALWGAICRSRLVCLIEGYWSTKIAHPSRVAEDQRGGLRMAGAVRGSSGGSSRSGGMGSMLLMLRIIMANFVCHTSYSVMDSFFPQDAQAKGLSLDTIGAVFMAFPLVVICSSPMVGPLMCRHGVPVVYVSGLAILAAATFAFAFCVHLPDGLPFAAGCVALRLVQGLGSALEEAAAYALIVSIAHEHVSLFLGVTEISTGMGYLVGPPMGGLLYSAASFPAPFLAIAILLACVALLVGTALLGPLTTRPARVRKKKKPRVELTNARELKARERSDRSQSDRSSALPLTEGADESEESDRRSLFSATVVLPNVRSMRNASAKRNGVRIISAPLRRGAEGRRRTDGLACAGGAAEEAGGARRRGGRSAKSSADGAAIARHREGVEPPPLTFYKLLQYRQERTPFSHMSHPIPPTSHRFNSCSLSL